MTEAASKRPDLVAAAMRWCDDWFDADASLLWNPAGSYDEIAPPRSLHLVPQSGWYAAGLLLRDEAGDAARSAAMFQRLCLLQYDEPGTIWHGTFARFAETRHPGPGAVEWVDYDPNWRQFLGTTFSLVLSRFDRELPAEVTDSMRQAIAVAIAGEPPERVPPSYSNIALMRSWLEIEHGSPERRAAAEEYAAAIVALFDEHGAFEEYNSPTYYGIDLYALALWARHSSSDRLRADGERLEAAVWDDISRWWHADLANLCGPWSRSYGMDMRAYAALLGLWIGPQAYPDLSLPFDHSHDTTFAPMVDMVGRGLTPAARAAIAAFPGEHTVEQRITDDRVATGWLAPRIMFGGEAGGPHPARGQYHPATAHWEGGWLRVRHETQLDATASAGRLEIEPRSEGVTTVIVEGDPSAVTLTVDGSALALEGPGKSKLTGARRLVVEPAGPGL